MAPLSERRDVRPARGFTLIEVMITMSILAVGLLAMLVLQVQALSDGNRGRHSSTGSMLAQDQIEFVQSLPFSSTALDAVDWTTVPWIDNSANPGLSAGEVPVTVTTPQGDTTERIYTVSYRVQADPGGNLDLKNVDLEVTWNEPDISNNRPTRTGQPTAALSTVVVNNDR